MAQSVRFCHRSMGTSAQSSVKCGTHKKTGHGSSAGVIEVGGWLGLTDKPQVPVGDLVSNKQIPKHKQQTNHSDTRDWSLRRYMHAQIWTICSLRCQPHLFYGRGWNHSAMLCSVTTFISKMFSVQMVPELPRDLPQHQFGTSCPKFYWLLNTSGHFDGYSEKNSLLLPVLNLILVNIWPILWDIFWK